MVGAGEKFLPAFALALGASAVTAGMLGALPILIGSTLQLAAPQLLARMGCYRKLVAGLAFLQALSFIPFVWCAYLGIHMPAWAFLMMATVYWASGLSSAAAWQSWMTRLVPSRLRTRYFAKRNRIGQLGLLFGLVSGGLLLQAAKQGGWELKAFAGLFLFSAASRVFSWICLTRQSSCSVQATRETKRPLREVFSKLHAGPEGSLFVFLLLFAVAVNISAPFFNPYMIQKLALPYGQFMWLTAAVFIAKVATFSSLGRAAQNMDPYRLMYFGLIGAALTPAFFLVSMDFVYLFAMQLISGASWALYELGLVLVLFRAIRDDERTRVLSVFNFASSFMVLAGTMFGGAVLSKLGDHTKTYLFLFAVSAGLRLLCIVLFEKAVVRIKGECTFRAPSFSPAWAPNLAARVRPFAPVIRRRLLAREAKTGSN